jgi:hypothetical protein
VKISKVCSCGKIHLEIPETARKWIEDDVLIGHVWECECKSTLFAPAFNVKGEKFVFSQTLKKAVGDIYGGKK